MTLFRSLTLIATLAAIGAALLALYAGVTGWERRLPDEGTGAHVFQLLILAATAALLGAGFLAVRRRSLAGLWAPAAALAAAVGAAAFFRL